MASEKTGAWVFGSSVVGAAEEQAVLRHREVDARAGEDQAVDAAEGGDHDGGGHHLHRDRAEHLAAAAVATRSWSACWICGEGQHVEVDELRGDVQRGDDQHAQRRATAADCACGLRTSPAVKVTLFQASEENSEPTMATPTSRTASKLQLGVAPEIGEVAGHRLGVAAHQEARTPTSPSSAADLGER